MTANYQSLSTTERVHASTELAQFDSLIERSHHYKIATKIAGCLCLPVTWGCCCLLGCCSMGNYWIDRDVRWTASPFYFGNPRPPPRDTIELFCNIFDPCVCCFWYWKSETSIHYLSPAEQEMFSTLSASREVRKQLINRALLGSSSQGEEGLAQIILGYVQVPPHQTMVVQGDPH